MSRAELTRTVGGLRRRMPRHLLPAFCLSLLLLGCACGPTHAVKYLSPGSVALFAAGRTKVPEKVGDEDPKRDVSSFGSPFLVGGNGVMVALAEAWFSENDEGERDVDIVARYIETEGANWVSKAIEKNEGNWKTQLVLQRREGVNHYVLSNPTAVIKGNKIYLLALTNWRNDSSQSDNGWHFESAVGAITGEVGSKKIEWGPSAALHLKLKREVDRKKLNVFPGFPHSAFLTLKGMMVFSASATNTEGTKGYAILQLEDDKRKWEVSFVEKPKGCRDFSLFEWKERLISVFFGCLTDTNYAKEYDEVKKEWKNADDRFLHVWISEHPPSDLTHVTIENKSALIFTGESRSTDDGTSEMPLYFTDGNRTKDLEWSIETPYTHVTSRRLLYTNGELFFIYQDTSKGLGAIVLTCLNGQLDEITFVLNIWATNDAYFLKPCNETAPERVSPDTLCVTPVPTDGLIGLLLDMGDSNHWIDDYYLMGAFVKGGVKVKNGYEFRGTNDGAWWPLGEMYPRKGYNFTRYGGTVVATVTIHETPKDNAPLLTVDGPGSLEYYGLWYKDRQWKVVSKNGDAGTATDLKTHKAYGVALMLHNNTIAVYVNGKSQGSPLPLSAPGEEPFNIKSIFIGRYGSGSGIRMTVTNVLLYNRVLSDTELEAVSKRVPPATSGDLEEMTEGHQ